MHLLPYPDQVAMATASLGQVDCHALRRALISSAATSLQGLSRKPILRWTGGPSGLGFCLLLRRQIRILSSKDATKSGAEFLLAISQELG
jgi:hypothetical protein